ncbi:right-handed parallel beta-helix repeat-containing protein [Carboxylicivirga marina]|uniref:right-handed parallel beta-helix repeat-containing protein n=1 Tax=Carboxylicivirga marina TaxID=2800988 RepID=UPI0025950895|nr:right-handed parallel beta-helix repeat-containing protein [uncultured Carboxylicivirga sp.]
MKSMCKLLLLVVSLVMLACSNDDNQPGLPYDQIPDKEYIIDVELWEIPTDGTQALKTTDNLQAAIDWAIEEGYGIIRLPAGHYLVGKQVNDVFHGGITLHSNMAFVLDKNALIEMEPNDKWNSSIIRILTKKYVVITGGKLQGDKDGHIYKPNESGGTAHDEGHLISVEMESEYVTIENMILKGATGDGILLVAGGEEGSSVKHIDIINNNIYENRRQGVSIVGGTNITIENNEIHHIKGTSPQFGVDIESLDYLSENIVIRNNYFHHNYGGHIVNGDGKNVLIEKNKLEQGEGIKYTDGAIVIWESHGLNVRENEITSYVDNDIHLVFSAILMYAVNDRPLDKKTGKISNNTINNSGIYMLEGVNIDIENNICNNGFMNFYDTINLKLNNNEVSRSWGVCRRYAFENVTGEANENTLEGVMYDIPLSSTPHSGDSCD